MAYRSGFGATIYFRSLLGMGRRKKNCIPEPGDTEKREGRRKREEERTECWRAIYKLLEQGLGRTTPITPSMDDYSRLQEVPRLFPQIQETRVFQTLEVLLRL